LLKRLDREVGPLITSLKGTSDTARASLVDLTQQLDRVAGDASRLMTSLTETSDAARGTVKDLSGDLQKTLAQLAVLAAKLQEVSDTLRGALETAHITLRDADGALTGDSPLGYKLQQALKEVAAAAQSLRALTEYLERHPESVLTGKSRGQDGR
jgi:paraquat-inducible protein B